MPGSVLGAGCIIVGGHIVVHVGTVTRGRYKMTGTGKCQEEKLGGVGGGEMSDQ